VVGDVGGAPRHRDGVTNHEELHMASGVTASLPLGGSGGRSREAAVYATTRARPMAARARLSSSTGWVSRSARWWPWLRARNSACNPAASAESAPPPRED